MEEFQQFKVLKISISAKKFSCIFHQGSPNGSLINLYLFDPVTFIVLIQFPTDPSPVWYGYCIYGHCAPGGWTKMQPSGEPKSVAQVKTATVAMVLITTTMIGTISGIFIADRDAFLLLTQSFASQLASVRGLLFPRANAMSAKPEPPDVIPIGLPSIVAMQYSSKPGSAHIAFDLQAMDLVRTGRLHSPDRIYFDLQDRRREQDTLRQPKRQKAVRIAGTLLTSVRISQRKRGATRIVLDLERSCDFTYQTLLGFPSRLVVEIRPRPTGTVASDESTQQSL